MPTDSQAPSDAISIIENTVRRIGNIPRTDTHFTTTTELFDSGYIESLGIVQLTSTLEETFRIGLTEQDMFDERFSTVQGIAAIVYERRSRLSNSCNPSQTSS